MQVEKSPIKINYVLQYRISINFNIQHQQYTTILRKQKHNEINATQPVIEESSYYLTLFIL